MSKATKTNTEIYLKKIQESPTVQDKYAEISHPDQGVWSLKLI